MRISVFDLAERQTVLTGSAAGRKLLAAMIGVTPAVEVPELLYLDFRGIHVATSSFLRESVIGFRDFARGTRQNIYPVVANAEPAVTEELEFFVKARGDVLWRCDLDDAGSPISASLIGDLEPAQRVTFDKVSELGTVTAPSLAATDGGTIGSTAWNNRLSALAGKGLIVERRVGKTKSFSTLLEVA